MSQPDGGRAARALYGGWTALLALCALAGLLPPAVVPADAPPERFSAARALEHARALAGEPRPMGSPGHARARAYLVSTLRGLGWAVEVQETTRLRNGYRSGGLLRNVVARLAGSRGAKAVLLAAHYDTVPASPGAGDNAAGAAALLECARALRAGPRLPNDVVLLFSDGEEEGLLGADAFAAGHRWFREAAVVLNFDARGTGGPVLMFETTPGNARLVRGLAAAAPRPVASSLMGAVYRALPNDTDLTVFREEGLPGMNFAFIGGASRYHSAADTLEHLDPRSVQHHGSYALALARRFGGEAGPLAAEEDAVYFDLLGRVLVVYPRGAALPLALLLALAWVLLVRGACRGAGLTVLGLARALALLVGGTVLAAAACWAAAEAAGRLHLRLMPGDDPTYNPLYGAGAALLGAALSARIGAAPGPERLHAGLLAAVLIALTAALFMPEASYLAAWPLAYGLAAAWLLQSARARRIPPLPRAALLGACAAGPVFLLVPALALLFLAMGATGPGAAGIGAGTALGLRLLPGPEAGNEPLPAAGGG